MHLGARGAIDETPPLLCLNSNPSCGTTGTVLSGQFDWGGLLNFWGALTATSDAFLAICWDIRPLPAVFSLLLTAVKG